MHQLNTKNIEIHEWEHECIHIKSKTIHIARIIYLNQKMISKDWLSIKKDNLIKQMKFLKFPHKSYLVKIQTHTSFSFFPSRVESFKCQKIPTFKRGLERQPRSIHKHRLLTLFFFEKWRIYSLSLQSFSNCIRDPQKSTDLFTPFPQTTHEKKPSKNLL